MLRIFGLVVCLDEILAEWVNTDGHKRQLNDTKCKIDTQRTN